MGSVHLYELLLYYVTMIWRLFNMTYFLRTFRVGKNPSNVRRYLL
jgi:hypothetical protein